MQLRHEYKHIITRADFIQLQSRLNVVMSQDAHVGPDGCYHIRSLYFDTANDRALHEKLDGINRREKFRIRIYNNDEHFIRLEKKIKIGDLGTKISTLLTKAETQQIMNGDVDFMRHRQENILQEFYIAIRYGGLRPKTLVDYDRRPYVYAPGNVRVTLDYNIRTGLYAHNLFDCDCPTMQAGDGAIILEVKYDNFLPDVIRSVIQVGSVSESAFSKYAACRQF